MTKHSSVTIQNDERLAQVEQAMQRFNYGQHALTEVLITVQELYGYLPKDILIHVSKRLRVPLSQVYGVATFYDSFSLEEPASEVHCTICTGPVCSALGAHEVIEAAQQQSGGKAEIKHGSCLGLCDQAPAALVNQQTQVKLSAEQVPAMLQGKASPAHLQVSGDPRILTAPIGRLAPVDLDAHREEGAFQALEKALREMSPEQVIAEVKDSRLAGRGGAGFQTGVKWEFTRLAAGPRKQVVCNFDESEPGTFKDRLMMEGNPFRVLEGLILSGYAVGAEQGYIFVRGEYPAASDIIEEALDALYMADLLGDHIMGSDYGLDVEVRHGAGAYICGEETALFENIEGKRGHPRMKPPYPTQQGLFGNPTAINNVETLTLVPDLVWHGGEWLHQWGTPHSVGVKLFCLSGRVKRPGVVEVPFGITLRELVERFGGGFEGDPQAILIGGAAGGFLHPDHLDTPLTHEALCEFDVPVGSGAIMVFNQDDNLWQVLEDLARFFVDETCGKCTPCRLGTQQIHKMLKAITAGKGTPPDVDRLEQLGQTIRQTCACGLGMTAANPALTALHHFNLGV